MKNRFLYILIVLSSLLSCGKEQPWNPQATAQKENPKEKAQDKAKEDEPTQKSETTAQLESTTQAESTTQGNHHPAGETNVETDFSTKVSFDEIRPLFEKHCMACHGVIDPKINWLDLETAREYVQNGKLYHRIWELKDDMSKGMPLGGGAISLEEREQIVEWIEGESA